MIERALADLPGHLDVTAAPDLVQRVRRGARRRQRQQRLASLAAVAVLGAGAATVLPGLAGDNGPRQQYASGLGGILIIERVQGLEIRGARDGVELTVAVRNRGDKTLTLTDAVIVGSQFRSTRPPGSLSPGERVTFTVRSNTVNCDAPALEPDAQLAVTYETSDGPQQAQLQVPDSSVQGAEEAFRAACQPTG